MSYYEAEPALSFRDLWSRMGWDMKMLFAAIALLLVVLALPSKPVIKYDARAVCDAVVSKELDAPSLRFVRYDGSEFIYRTERYTYECRADQGVLRWGPINEPSYGGGGYRYAIQATPAEVKVIRTQDGLPDFGVPPTRDVWTMPNKAKQGDR